MELGKEQIGVLESDKREYKFQIYALASSVFGVR